MKSPHKGWIMVPVLQAVSFVGEETKNAGLLKRALIHLEGGRSLFRSVQMIAQRTGMKQLAQPVSRLLAESPTNEVWAKELRDSDYATLNAHALVAIWGALETCVEDTIIHILVNWPDAASLVALPPLAITLTAPESDEDVQKVWRKIEQKFQVKGNVVATYQAILNHFSLSAVVTEEQSNILREANAARNCLLHRGGFVDQRARNEAPTLAAAEGDTIRVTSDAYLRYHEAIGQWLVSLSKSTGESIYFPPA